MSITAVPISILLVLAPTAASSGKGEASWPREMMHAEIGAVGAELLRPRPQARWIAAAHRAAERVCDCGEGVQWSEGQKSDFLHAGNLGRTGRLQDRRRIA